MLGTATKLKTARKITLSGAVSGNANFDGNSNITITTTQSNIAVLTGTITTPEANTEALTGQTDINYPSGYNRTNCVVISIMGSKAPNIENFSTSVEANSLGYMLGASGLSVTLQESNIRIRRKKSDVVEPSSTSQFKLVLMKIS